MNRQAIVNLSTEILLRYYDNDVSMFLEYLDDHVLWYGPAERQFLRGREAMVAAWASENNPLTFTKSAPFYRDHDRRPSAADPGKDVHRI